MQSVLASYSLLQTQFEILAMKNSEGTRMASGLKHIVDKFSVYFGLKICILLFSAADKVSNELQRKSVTYEDKCTAVDALVKYL